MNHLKTYESRYSDNWVQEYNIGDVIEIYEEDKDEKVYNEYNPFEIIDIDETELPRPYCIQSLIDEFVDNWIGDDQIVRQLEQHEIDALKYNL